MVWATCVCARNYCLSSFFTILLWTTEDKKKKKRNRLVQEQINVYRDDFINSIGRKKQHTISST